MKSSCHFSLAEWIDTALEALEGFALILLQVLRIADRMADLPRHLLLRRVIIMTARKLRSPLVAAAFILVLAPLLPAADPLPKAAKVRLGTTRLRNSNSWSGAALTADGKHLVMAGSKGLTRYDVSSGEEAGTLGPRPAGFNFGSMLHFNADESRGLTAAYNAVSVWDVKSGKVLAEVKRPMPYGEAQAVLSADGKTLAVGSLADNKDKGKPLTALIWDVDRSAKRVEVAVLQNQSAYVALSGDGKLLATWGNHFEPNPPPEGVDPAKDPNRLVQFWDAATGKELAKIRAHGFGTTVVAFSPDGQTAAVAHGNGAIRLVDPKSGEERRLLFGRANQGYRLAFSPDGKMLATAGMDGTVQLWGLSDGARLGVVECPLGPLQVPPREIRFTGEDRAVVWTAMGSAALVWEAPSGKLLSPVGGHVAAVESVVFAPDGKEILTSGADGQILKWDFSGKSTGSIRLRQPSGLGDGYGLAMRQVDLTADGKQAILGQGTMGVFDVATGQQLSVPTGVLGFDIRPYLCSDARTLVAVPVIPFPPKPVPKSLKVDVWDIQTGARLAQFEIPTGDLLAAAVTPDRTKLLTGVATRASEGGKTAFLLAVWDLTNGKKLGEESLATGYGSVFIAPAPDSKTALVATAGGKLVAIDTASGKVTKEIDTAGQRLTAAPVFGPGAKQLAVPLGVGFGPSATAAVRLYDVSSWKTVATLEGHESAITCLAFSPDGKTLATGSQDTTVLLWDLSAAPGK
jgi:WD40 repeat protein